jgi:3-oxoacyl-[acyl-carrier-protein] synthase II
VSGRAAVVTGVGVVAGASAGVEAFAAALAGGNVPLRAIDPTAGHHRLGSASQALLVDDVDLSAWVSPPAARRLSRPSVFGVAAARQALADAGLADVRGPRTAVVMATAFGAIAATEQIVHTTATEGPQAVSPSVFPESVANAAGAHIAIATGAHGANVTLVHREAGALAALGRGADEIARGRADIALVGATEEMRPVLHAYLDRCAALARRHDSDPEAARPFDARRNGFLAAEGAAVLVLESEEHARARQARIYTRVRAHARAFDPSASRAGFGRGAARLGEALRTMLRRAGTSTLAVDRVVSGASGAVAGDCLEAATLVAAWQDGLLPPMTTPKRVTGEYGGGFLAAAVLATLGVTCPPVTDAVPDAALPLTPPIHPLHGPASLTLVTSLACGGAASWVLLESAA